MFFIRKSKAFTIDFDPYCKTEGGGKFSPQNANRVVFVSAFVLYIKWIFAYQPQFCSFLGICLPTIQTRLDCGGLGCCSSWGRMLFILWEGSALRVGGPLC